MLAVAQHESLPVQAARNGDPAAWDALFERYQLPLHAFIAQSVRNTETALDLVQETFLSALRHIDTLRDDAKLGSWLFGIAHQKCAQHWRRHRDTEPWEEHHEPDAEPEDDPAGILVRKEESARFLALLDQLPPPHRTALTLHFLEDFSLEEIAAITGVPLGTVKSRLHFAKRTLRERLEASDL